MTSAMRGSRNVAKAASLSKFKVSIASAGWQQVKISRSRSSSMVPAGSGGSSSYTS
jgi:hypothetical protein